MIPMGASWIRRDPPDRRIDTYRGGKRSGAAGAPATAAAAATAHELLRHQRRPRRRANLGGLAGADRHCQALAQAAGAGNRTWRAYLSQTAAPATGTLPVNARDRIGSGPWYNAKGVIIAANVEELHGDSQRDRNNIRKPIALNEKGEIVPGSGDTPNIHDILTGSDSHGRALIGDPT